MRVSFRLPGSAKFESGRTAALGAVLHQLMAFLLLMHVTGLLLGYACNQLAEQALHVQEQVDSKLTP